ncbi:Avr9/Cf-9 rapidly elicited protein [Parasponia andersonii]|uniref:Avr9/Cf-9 rapidly elicited protein n=1 Tax=Parasponia andersonii TaxID=3476 RepID=A0A2P5DFC0_PARAD|nr:Avr9/Cf-9 rapidly elicited protein [Parasponia andersonii]
MMMMMSMFSSFDALFVEISKFSIGAGKPNAMGIPPPPPPPSASSLGSVKNDKREENIKNKNDSDGASMNSTTTQRKQQRMPTFAPEFDGLHCFETILPC